MAWAMVAGAAVGAISGMAGDKKANNEAKSQDVADRNAAADDYAGRLTDEGKYRADIGNSRVDNQWGQDNINASNRSQSAQNMFGTKYGIKNAQVNYDHLQGEFGDFADNIKSHFKTLSPSSVRAQNNDAFNEAMAVTLESTDQHLVEQGINPGSGFSAALKTMVKNNTATSKVLANRNVDTEVANAKMGFLDSAVQNPLFQARPVDFSEGMLSEGELNKLNFTNPNQITDSEVQGYDVHNADLESRPKQSGGAFMGAVGGALGGLF